MYSSPHFSILSDLLGESLNLLDDMSTLLLGCWVRVSFDGFSNGLSCILPGKEEIETAEKSVAVYGWKV